MCVWWGGGGGGGGGGERDLTKLIASWVNFHAFVVIM